MKILVTEDDLCIRRAMCSFLSRSGNMVRGACDPWSTAVEIRLNRPDLVIADMHIPGVDGHALLTALRRDFPGISLFGMRARYSDEEHPLRVNVELFYGSSQINCPQMLEFLGAITSPPDHQAMSYGRPLWMSIRTRRATSLPVHTLCPICYQAQSLDDGSNILRTQRSCHFCNTPIS